MIFDSILPFAAKNLRKLEISYQVSIEVSEFIFIFRSKYYSQSQISNVNNTLISSNICYIINWKSIYIEGMIILGNHY